MIYNSTYIQSVVYYIETLKKGKKGKKEISYKRDLSPEYSEYLNF